MKRPRCTQCKHTMKGHKKQRCKSHGVIVDDNGTYTGSLYNGKPSGQGCLVCHGKIYVGQFLAGAKSGHGVETGTTGYRYEGNWVNGTYHGFGTLEHPDCNNFYEGNFLRGKKHGRGLWKRGTHESYDGMWRNGTKSGRGTHTNTDGTYVGMFASGMRNGGGVFTDVRGHVYDGTWHNGYRHGRGTYTTPVSCYTGQWSNNRKHGMGKWKSTIHGQYNGRWKRGMRHFNGIQRYKNGSIYTGSWSYGQRTGHGQMMYTDGSKYDGFWCHDAFNGTGTLTRDDTTFEGVWSNGHRDGVFVENSPTHRSTGKWRTDQRHGIFTDANECQELYLCGKKTKLCRSILHTVLESEDWELARDIFEFNPSLIGWKLFNLHDDDGVLLYMLDTKTIEAKLKKHAWGLYKEGRYTFIETMVNLCTEEVQTAICDCVGTLFDCITREFVANPWIVRKQSYSAQTREKLLTGLHLGDFGRCEPLNPFTRQPILESSGVFLSTTPKLARRMYMLLKKSMTLKHDIRSMSYSFDLEDLDKQIQTAQEAGDKASIRLLLLERDTFIKEYRPDIALSPLA